jgi:hypothetical protein
MASVKVEVRPSEAKRSETKSGQDKITPNGEIL